MDLSAFFLSYGSCTSICSDLFHTPILVICLLKQTVCKIAKLSFEADANVIVFQYYPLFHTSLLNILSHQTSNSNVISLLKKPFLQMIFFRFLTQTCNLSPYKRLEAGKHAKLLKDQCPVELMMVKCKKSFKGDVKKGYIK